MTMLSETILSLIGGLMIGVAAVALLYWLGRISGISGIFWVAVRDLKHWNADSYKQNSWRWMFIVGLMLGSLLIHALTNIPQPSANQQSWLWIIFAGLLVGFGTKLGSGCTSGHGVCGIGRLSPRSIVATAVFMATGIITVYVVRHLLV